MYGKLHLLPYEEDHPTEPVSPYGVTKLTQDAIKILILVDDNWNLLAPNQYTESADRYKTNPDIRSSVAHC
ncbi:hypothetical protein PM020_16925 [Halorubrum ezzemoulense]|nr:hypothetical protein [Halorubrum ezzemoulense]